MIKMNCQFGVKRSGRLCLTSGVAGQGMVISKRVGGRGNFVSDAASGAQGVVATWE